MKENGVQASLLFDKDATANAQLIARTQQAEAKSKGSSLVDAQVKSVERGKVIWSDGTEIKAAGGSWVHRILDWHPSS